MKNIMPTLAKPLKKDKYKIKKISQNRQKSITSIVIYNIKWNKKYANANKKKVNANKKKFI